MSKKIFGYAGKLLRVDLTEGKVIPQPLDEDVLRNYLGGTGLGVKILYEEVPPIVQWADPQNRIIFASGPLGGTRVPGSGTYAVVTLGAINNGACTSQANGFFGAYMRFSGFDGIVVQGASEDWVYLHIHEGKAEIRDAKHLVGLDIFETEDAIKKELGQKDTEMSVAAIGPAGENLVKFAIIASDKGHIVGHNGNGAVMGSKKLKAIAVSRKGNIVAKDPETLKAVAKELSAQLDRGFGRLDVKNYGTLEALPMGQMFGMMPVKNYQTNTWEMTPDEISKWKPEYLREQVVKKRPCWACQATHCTTMKIPEGTYAGRKVEEPEYEGLTSMGPVIENNDALAALALCDDTDRLGMDVNETGWLISLVMECYQKGLLNRNQTDGLEMEWGNVKAVSELLPKIAKRQGFGDILAEGVMRAAQKIGGDAPNFAIHAAKGHVPRSHDHRIWWIELLDTCVSSGGTIEVDVGAPLKLWDLKAPMNFFGFGLPEEVATIVGKTKGSMQFEDSLGTCRFNTQTNIPLLCQAINAATGWDMTFEKAMAVGRRAINLTRIFHLRRGVGPDLDRPSPRYGSTPSDGPAATMSPMAVWDQMLQIYYSLMEWDKNGIPLPETLEDLGLKHVIPDLPQSGLNDR